MIEVVGALVIVTFAALVVWVVLGVALTDKCDGYVERMTEKDKQDREEKIRTVCAVCRSDHKQVVLTALGSRNPVGWCREHKAVWYRIRDLEEELFGDGRGGL